MESPTWDERLSILTVVWHQEAEVNEMAAIKKLILFMRGNLQHKGAFSFDEIGTMPAAFFYRRLISRPMTFIILSSLDARRLLS